jgi:serine protease Do
MRSKLFSRVALTFVALLTAVPFGAAMAMAAEPPTSTPGERASAIVSPSIVFLLQDWTAYVKAPGQGTTTGFVDGYVDADDDFTADAFEWTSRCTGFVINPNGYVVTAGHCVDDTIEGAKDTALQFAIGSLVDAGVISDSEASTWYSNAVGTWTVEGASANSPPDRTVTVFRAQSAGGVTISNGGVPARVLDFSSLSKGDVALLKVEQADLPALKIARAQDITIGTELLSVGYPGSTDQVTDASFTPDFKDGQVSSKRTREDGLLPVYEVSSALSGGMSGGPTVNLQGDVVGVNSFSIEGETEAFNFITPASLVLEMMSRNGATNQLGTTDEEYRAGLDAYFEGQQEQAIQHFDEVLALVPTHAQAQEYRVKANRELRLHPAGGGGLPMVAIIGGVAVLVALGGLGFFFLSRRKKGAPQAPPQPAMQQPAYATAPPTAPVAAPQAPVSANGPPTSGMPHPEAAPAPAAAPGPAPAPSPAPVWEAPREAVPVGFQPPRAESVTAAPEAAIGTPAVTGVAEQPKRFCGNCGAQATPGKRFCQNCGQPLD